MKIFELARALGMDSRELLGKAGDLGIQTSTSLSTLGGQDIDRLLKYLGKELPGHDPATPAAAKEKPPAKAPSAPAPAAPRRSSAEEERARQRRLAARERRLMQKPGGTKPKRRKGAKIGSRVSKSFSVRLTESGSQTAGAGGGVEEVVLTSTLRDLSPVLGVPLRALRDWLGREREERVADTARPNAEELAALLANFGFPEVKVVEPKRETVDLAPSDPEKQRPRVPVVTVMGHVDHGKTTLLDKIRSTTVAAGEAGAITQSIGASVATAPDGRQVTFIDTPGHHSFTAMRARGAQVTDVAVLVVAADEGPRDQTKEALEHMRAAGVEFVVAVNKMDHKRANLDRALKGLQGLGVEPAQWGGDVSCFPVSAVTGEGVPELLEGILELADVLELRADPSAKAQGVVVESFIRDGGRSASVVVTEGTLRPRDVILFDNDVAMVRALIGPEGERLEEVEPGLPAEIQGLVSLPDPGERFAQVKNQKAARRILKDRQKGRKGAAARGGADVADLFATGPEEEFRLLLKASSHGALEAVRGEIERLESEAVDVLIVNTGVGDITDADVNLAHSAGAALIGFEVGIDGKAAQNARSKGTKVDVYNLIYELVDKVRGKVLDSMAAEEEEVETARLEVLAVFRRTSRLTIAGGKVVEGPLKRGSRCRLLREGEVRFQGRVDNLKRFKDDVKEVRAGMECGFRITGNPGVEPGDELVAYEVRRTERTAKEVFGA